MLGHSLSCLVPPAKAESPPVAWASSRPLNVHGPTTLVDVRVGGEPVHVVGAKLFQSKLIGACGARFPSSSSKPAAVPMGPGEANPAVATVKASTSAATAANSAFFFMSFPLPSFTHARPTDGSGASTRMCPLAPPCVRSPGLDSTSGASADHGFNAERASLRGCRGSPREEKSPWPIREKRWLGRAPEHGDP